MAVEYKEGLAPIGGQSEDTSLKKINQLLFNESSTGSTGGMVIPPNDTQEFAYYGSTNNIQTITYKSGGSTVATQTFTYVSGGASDDDLIQSIVLT